MAEQFLENLFRLLMVGFGTSFYNNWEDTLDEMPARGKASTHI